MSRSVPAKPASLLRVLSQHLLSPAMTETEYRNITKMILVKYNPFAHRQYNFEILCVAKRSSYSCILYHYMELSFTSHALSCGRESALTVRNGAEVVCVRNFLIFVRWAILHWIRWLLLSIQYIYNALGCLALADQFGEPPPHINELTRLSMVISVSFSCNRSSATWWSLSSRFFSSSISWECCRTGNINV